MPLLKHMGGGVMIWACFRAAGSLDCAVAELNIFSPLSKTCFGVKSLPDKWNIQQSNKSKHSSAVYKRKSEKKENRGPAESLSDLKQLWKEEEAKIPLQ